MSALKKKLFIGVILILVLFVCCACNYRESKSNIGVSVSNDLISLTDTREIMVSVDFDYEPDLGNLEWTLGEKPFSEWQKFNVDTGGFDGDTLITFTTEPYLEGNTVNATIKFDIAYDPTSSDSTWGFVKNYQPLVGNHALSVTDTANDKTVSSIMNVKVYDRYHTYDEIKPAIDKITQQVKPGRYIKYMSNGKSVEGRDMHFVILAKDEASVDKYLNETLPMMLEHPEELQQKIADNTMGDYKIPIWFSNIHPNEVPATDSIIEIFESFATEDDISYDVYEREDIPMDGDNPGKHIEVSDELKEKVNLNVEDVLDDVILLFNFTTNPDGRYSNVRTNANGFDLNRDCSFQTQPESRNIIGALGKWRPIIFLEYHGFYKELVIAPPTTAPHDPNVEYDLILGNNVELAHALGIAGISNTSYSEYQIPYLDLDGGWDDSAPNYTDYYVQSLGSIGSVIEIPDPNEESIDVLKYASFAAIDYLKNNKDRLFINQLEIFRRGIQGLDEKEKVDQYFVDPDNQIIGRPRGNNENFFPQYYVIPVDKSMQINSLEAYKMAEHLIRSGVKVDKTTQDVKIGNINYLKGSYVVDMHQATRAIANNFLYDGIDASSYPGIYSENVIAMHDTLGFDRYEIRELGAFNGKTERVNNVEIPKTDMTGIQQSKQYVVKNNNNDAVRAVNALLKEGKTVQMLLSSEKGAKAGDYIISREDLDLVKDNYLLDVDVHNGIADMITLSKPTVAALAVSTWSSDGSLEFTLKELGFDVVNNLAESNIIVSQAATDVATDIIHGKSYIGLGSAPMTFLKESSLLPGFDFIVPNRESSEALLYSKVSQDNPITGCYEEVKVIYNVRGGYITGVPKGAEVLTSVLNEDSFFKAGYWQNNTELKGKTLSFSTKVGQANVTIFANDIAFRAVNQSDWRMLANAIFTSVSE